MRIFSGKNKIESQQRYTALPDNEPTDPEAWKARLVEQLPPLHDRSPFDHLVSDYLTEDKKPDLSSLVSGCITNGNVPVLTYILANEDIKRLCIKSLVDERGFTTLAKAMPDSLPVEELKLERVTLSASKCKLLFDDVVKCMPALKSLDIKIVKVKHSISLGQFRCSDFPPLEKLEVSGVGAYTFLRKFLDACQVQHLSVAVSKRLSVSKCSELADMFREQTQMNGLRLRIKHHGTPEEFECFMPFLCGKTHTPLVELDLSGCCIQVRNFNELIAALPSNQPALKSLFLSGCAKADDRTHKDTVNINLVPLAELKGLEHLDLSSNHLPRGRIAALLTALKEAATPLLTLNLSKNQIGPPAVSALASFLADSKTLSRVLFETSMLQADLDDSLAMMALVDAADLNQSLVELKFRWTLALGECHASVDASLERNRRAAFMGAAVQTAATFTMPQLLNKPWPGEILASPQLSGPMIQHIIGQGLTEHDALTLSSLNHETRAAHEEFLRKTGS